jgi:perosamine synthetase
MSQLALLSGKPVRKKMFASPVIVSAEEKKMILRVLEKKEFSRFMGSPSADTEKLLCATSQEAVEYNGQYFTFLGGEMVRRFEADFSRWFGVKFAISVNSATSGLTTALGACGIGPGDEVITTSLSFNATALSILPFNGVPKFCDVDPNTFCITPEQIRKCISSNTKAIIVVHLLGRVADMDGIMAIARKHHLKVIEDCAQAPGSKYREKYVGTIGDVGVFSLQETKNFSTGEGGMIVCNDGALAKRCRMIRNHGESIPDENWPSESIVNLVGFNFRMTELTAALGIAQLKKLKRNNQVRNNNANYLSKRLFGVKGLTLPQISWQEQVCHVFPLLYDATETGVSRDLMIKALRAEGIPVSNGYLRLMPENPIFSKRIAFGNKGCPFACPFYNGTVDYSIKNFPVAKDLLVNRFIWFYHINRPNTFHDMDDVVQAFKKIELKFGDLKNYHGNVSSKIYKW